MSSITAYAVERFPWRVFVPAIALHAFAAWWSAVAPAHALMVSTALITLLFVAFRLWDDLEDADRDRVVHPRRVLVIADRSPFRRLLGILLIATGLLFAGTLVGRVAFASLAGGMWTAYRWLRPQVSDPLWRFGILLAKYPAFVVLVANALGPAPLPRVAVAATTSYFAACVFEASHHRTSGVER